MSVYNRFNKKTTLCKRIVKTPMGQKKKDIQEMMARKKSGKW